MHNSRYDYERGIPDDISYRNLINVVFIIQNKDKKQIIDFLEQFCPNALFLRKYK